MRGRSRASLLTVAACLAGCDGDAGDQEESPPLEVRILLDNVSSAGALRTGDASGVDIILSSGVATTHDTSARLYELGEDVAGTGLEALAEDGDPAPLLAELRAAPETFFEVVQFSATYGAGEEGDLLGPDTGVVQTILAPAGSRLSLVMMFVQSNDVLLATPPEGIALEADAGVREITASLSLQDAGTELDEPPGTGPTQAPRQSAPNTGEPQGGTVAPVDPATYPAVESFLRATIEVTATDPG